MISKTNNIFHSGQGFIKPKSQKKESDEFFFSFFNLNFSGSPEIVRAVDMKTQAFFEKKKNTELD